MSVPADRPRISIVVFVRDPGGFLLDTLASLRAQEGIERSEVILADASNGEMRAAVERGFPAADCPWLRHLSLPACNMPAGKGRAIAAARGEIVAILDARDRAEPGWLREIEQGLLESGAEAIGGEVLFDGAPRGANGAGYLFEYGSFAPPLHSGVTDGDLPGNNVAYRRRVFSETCADLLERGFWKPFVHTRIRERGGELRIHPPMRVRHSIDQDLLAFCGRRFHYGRCFGAMRLENARGRTKWLYLVFAPFVALLLCVRHISRAWRHAGNRRILVHAFSSLSLVSLAWGVGEWLGTWFGAGRSCERVY